MNYDAQQYTFSHGLPSTPQLHLQQQLQQHQLHHHHQQQFQQQQQIFQQQYSQAVPTSNVYQFQFTGGGSPVNHIFHPKDGHQMGVLGSIQPRLAQHSIVPQPIIKQGVPVSIDVVSGLDGMIYSQQKNHLKIITNPDGRLMQQPEDAVRMQHALVGVDMMASSNFVDQSMSMQQNQRQGIGVAGPNNMFAYGKQHFSGWLQPQQISMSGTTGCQSTLPSFNHVWSQFQHQKQIDVLHQQQLNQYQQPQQFQNQLPQQHQMQTQLQFTAPSFQTSPSIQRIKIPQQKPQQVSVPVSLQTVSHLQQDLNCFSPQSNLISPRCIDKEVSNINRDASSKVKSIPISQQPSISMPCVQSISSCTQHLPTTAVTYTISGPPKVTVTLDSLTHSETFPPNQFPDRPEVSFNSQGTSANLTKNKIVKTPSSISSSMLAENFHSQTHREWQATHNQRNSCLPKSLVHSSSTGSSLERSSSESSNFSSPPYIFTPPSSSDSMFSPVHTQFLKAATESSSSGRTSALSSSSSSMSSSSSPPAASSLSSQLSNLYATTAVPTITTASSSASSTCTMSAATVVSSCSSVAITTTSVMTTIPTPKENTSIASGHSAIPAKKTISCSSESLGRSCSPARRPSTALPEAIIDNLVKVPYSWQRKFENGGIVYLSPSGAVLQSLDQVCHYLLSDRTCKCGLECPIQLDKFFNFDPKVGSLPWSACSAGENLGSLCNHRREILALAAFRSSQSEAVVRPAGRGVWLGRKRERRKSVSAGASLIVAPFKKLKTSITNAVNRHALSLGNGPSLTPPAADSSLDQKSVGLDSDSLFKNLSRQTSLSPASSRETPGSCSSNGDFSVQGSPGDDIVLGKSDFQRTQSTFDGDDKMLGSVAMQKIVDRSQQDFYHMQEHQAVEQGSRVPNNFRLSRDEHLLHQGDGRGLIMSMQNQYPPNVTSHSNQLMMQYPQGKHPRHHHQQPANPGLFFHQNHLYPNMPQEQQQQSQGFHPPVWQGSCADSPSSVPFHHHHHPPRTCPSINNYQHSTFNNPQPNKPSQHIHETQLQVNCTKAKSKRPKSKNDKQKQIHSIVDRSSPCLKLSARSAITPVIPSTSASFFGNPIVFVEQQAAIINSSIASCQMTFSSPSPPRCESATPLVTYPPLKDTSYEFITNKTPKENVISGPVGLLDKNENVSKEDDEDQKTGTDLDSNKSFSDTMENNDSAYLSQTGSDQEKSDVLDNLETKPTKSLDVFNFNSSENRERKQIVVVSHKGAKSSELNLSSSNTLSSKNSPSSTTKTQKEFSVVTSKVCGAPTNCQDTKKITKLKPRQKTVTHTPDSEMIKKNLSSNLNGDLSQLLASNNWNIPALQQVLANYSGGGPGQLNTAVQQVQSQTSTGVDFPASNLLSAAARAQLNLKQKEQVPNLKSVSQNSKIEVLPMPVISSSVLNDLKAGIVSTAVCGTVVSPVVTQQQFQPSFQQVASGGPNLIGNMMQFQHLPSGSFAMNMLLPANGQGHVYTTDGLHSGTFNADSDIKNGTGTLNPLMAQGLLATVSQTGDINSQIKLSVASMIPSSLGPSVGQCTAENSTMLLNSFGPGMIMNGPMPPVSVSVVTNVTKSLAQVIPAIGINQTVFGAQQVPQQLLSSHQNGAQIINTVPATPGTHMISTSPQGAQLINTAPQGAQFVNPAARRTQLISGTPQAAQIMNALSVGGLNNQLLITNPIQQMSPSNSLSQLSPAVAAQILAQSHPQLPQMSPSYLQNQIQKHAQNSVIGNQNMFSNVSLPTLTVTSDSTDVISGSVTQAGIINNNFQKSNRVCDGLDKIAITNNLSQIPDTNASLANSSMYATSNQPVFVIPQPNPNSVMQMLGPAQTLNTTPGLSGDLSLQQNNLTQMFGQSAAIDQSVIQNLLAAGFSPLSIQQMMNAISLNGVQQQQFQLLQLQQLMLQQLQNQGIPLPLNSSSNPSQATAIGTPTIVSTVMPQAGLQLNSLMDMNTLHPCLSPVAQGYQNQLSPATAPLQHISSALAVHQVTHVNSCGAVSVVQSGGMQNLMQIPAKQLQAGHTIQSQQLSADQFPCGVFENVLSLHTSNINRSLI